MFSKERVVFFSIDGVTQATHFLYKNEVFSMTPENLSMLPKTCEVYLNPTNIDLVHTDESIPEMLSVVDIKNSISIFARFPEECFKLVEEGLLNANKLPTFYCYAAPIRRLDRGVYFEIYNAQDAGTYRLTFFSIEEDLGSIGTVRINASNTHELSNAIKEIVVQYSSDTEMHLYSNDALPFDIEPLFAGYPYEISKKSFVFTGKSRDFTKIPSNEVERKIAHKVGAIGLTVFALSIAGVSAYQYWNYSSLTTEIEEGQLEIQRLQNEKSRLEIDLKSHAPAIAAYYATDTQPDWIDFFTAIRDETPEGSSFSKLEVSKSASFMKPTWSYVARLDLPSIAVSFVEYKDAVKNNRYFKNATLVEHLTDKKDQTPFVMLNGTMPVYRNGIEIKQKGGSGAASVLESGSDPKQSGASVFESKRAKSLGISAED